MSIFVTVLNDAFGIYGLLLKLIFILTNRVVDLGNFIICMDSKWSKSTCPTKIYLPEN